ncbi:MAG: hypothetical protein LBS26_01120 [Campylobacteraceae bacterium]|jgi:hypothetical protein|nr:hypothetical protein [Campylobacteraceae bacterium]
MRKIVLILALCFYANAAQDAVSGVYLSDIYIDELQKSKSHMQALDKFINATNASKASAILIDGYNIIYFYNHSDTETKNITVLETKIITVMNQNGTLYDIKSSGPSFWRKTRIEDDGIKYTQIGHIRDVVRAWSYFITKTIFGDKHYRNKNGEEFFLDEHGRLYYKDIKYELAFSIQNHYKYDMIYSKDKTYFISIKNNKIYIYEYIGKENEPEKAEFILADELT